MSLVNINWNVTPRQLRQFGLTALVALPLIGWVWNASGRSVLWLVVGGATAAILGWVAPALLRPVYLALSLITAPIGIVVSEAAMLLVYFGVLCPIGLIFRLLHRDALGLKLDRDGPTYWQPRKQPAGPESYYRQS